MSDFLDLLVIGAGPIGLAVGIAAREAGVSCLLVDKGTIVSTIERYPLGMTFFSTPEKIELGGIPFIASLEKPNRREGMLYYRRVAEHHQLDVRTYELVTGVQRDGPDGFIVRVRRPHETGEYRARNVVFATGYYDTPNRLGVPGEDLSHVYHYFSEGHHFWHRRVVIVGAGNSAVDAALECWRAGARVTLVHFAEQLDSTIKAWVLPDIKNRIKEGSITACWRSRVTRILPEAVEIARDGQTEIIPCDAVLAMIGYHADTTLLERLGVPVDAESGVPAHDERTMATPIPGAYVAGVLAAGKDANRLFIENSRVHADLILKDILQRGAGGPPGRERLP